MATAEDANLILKLYDLRREEKMRLARDFVLREFNPQSADDILALSSDTAHPERSAYYRQAVSYWEMVAALVNHGTIDPALFYDTNGEYLAIWAKIGEFVPQLRETFGAQYLASLEKLIQAQPKGMEWVQTFREWFKRSAAMRVAEGEGT